MNYPIIIHGSENSLDIDAYIIVDKVFSNQDAKKMCSNYPELNANLIMIENGQVVWSYKGTEDECNNSILATYHLHEQTYPNPITSFAQRSYGLKFARTLRGLLSHCSRTQYRQEIKKALTSDNLEFKLNTLKNMNLNQIEDFEKSSKIEVYKFFAFQLGQTLALLEDNEELFTKNSVGSYYPQLSPYLQRKENISPQALEDFFKKFLNFCETSYKKIENHSYYEVNFNDKKEFVDFKKEEILKPVVIFDLDGTLFDERHRSSLREEKKWKEYFELCHLDKPIENMIDILKDYKNKGYEVWIMSGRAEEYCMEKTLLSLKENNIPYDNIKLRGKDVFLPDHVLKPAWVSKYIGKQRVHAVYDDSENVIEGFRKKGLNVIDVRSMISYHKKATP